jgi:hypothetical protein
MKNDSIRWGLVLSCGWGVILVAAAIILPRFDSRQDSFPLLWWLLVIIWFCLTTFALWRYFYRGWQRVSLVPNKAAYVSWLSFETLAAVGIYVLLAGIMFVPVLDGPHSRRLANEAFAASKLHDIVTLQDEYMAAHAYTGYACDLSLLKPIAQQKFPESAMEFLTAGVQSGYRFSLVSCGSDASRASVRYQVAAVPVERGKTGLGAFCADETGAMWYDAKGSATNCLLSRRAF